METKKNSIRCPKCGTRNTEDAKFCETCGANIESIGRTLKKPNREMRGKLLLITVIVIASGLLCGMGIGFIFQRVDSAEIVSSDRSNNGSIDETSDALMEKSEVNLEDGATDALEGDSGEENEQFGTDREIDIETEEQGVIGEEKNTGETETVDAIPEEERETEKSNSSIMTTYSEVLDAVYEKYRNINADTLLYVAYDIDGNGVDEILVSEGISDAECVWNVYTKSDGIVINTGQCPGAYSSLCAASDGYLYMVNCCDKREQIYQTSLSNNKLVVNCIMDKVLEGDEQYYFPEGEYLTGARLTDKSLLSESKQTEEEDNGKNYMLQSGFQDILEEYKAAVNKDSDYRQKHQEEFPHVNQIMVGYYQMAGGNFGYALYDIDGNGTEEMLISLGEDDYYSICDVYASDGKKAYRMFYEDTIGDRSLLTIYTDGIMYIYSSGGAAYGGGSFYRIDADGYTPVLLEEYTFDAMEYPNTPWVTVNKKMTNEEYEHKFDGLKKVEVNSLIWNKFI